jgi:EPS-associated MarR family transcriptional regulator
MESEEIRLRMLRIVSENPKVSQRELSELLGISLGKTNYCLQALVEKGLVKMNNFKSNKNKLAYAYLLTPGGIEEKALLTVRFLKKKMAEYEALKGEIEQLRRDAGIDLPQEQIVDPEPFPGIHPDRGR